MHCSDKIYFKHTKYASTSTEIVNRTKIIFNNMVLRYCYRKHLLSYLVHFKQLSLFYLIIEMFSEPLI